MPEPPAAGPDPEALRAAVRARWERAAAGWRARHDRFQAAAMPVSRWLVDAIRPQPGQRVLELAAGVAELIAPGGTLLCTDGAEAMLVHARERARELGLRNVEFKPVELEWIDLPAAAVDAVLCRWGYMFALDREAALRETRRVLRPGGRLALATWAPADRNPWSTTVRGALYDAGLIDAPEPPSPHPFELGDPAALRALLEDAGFADVELEEVAVAFRYDDADDWLAVARDLSAAVAEVVDPLDDRQREDLRARLRAAAAPFADADGRLTVPGVALVAAADA